MIEPAFRALSVSPAGRLARSPTRQIATRCRAIGMAAIAGRTNSERTIAEATDLLAKGRVHDVGAAARFDWTRRSDPWHKRDDRLGRRRSIEVVTEGLEASTPGPHLIRRSAQLTPSPCARLSRRNGPCSCHRQMASRAPLVAGIVAPCLFQGGALRSASFAGSAPVLFRKNERAPTTTTVQIYAVSGEC